MLCPRLAPLVVRVLLLDPCYPLSRASSCVSPNGQCSVVRFSVQVFHDQQVSSLISRSPDTPSPLLLTGPRLLSNGISSFHSSSTPAIASHFCNPSEPKTFSNEVLTHLILYSPTNEHYSSPVSGMEQYDTTCRQQGTTRMRTTRWQSMKSPRGAERRLQLQVCNAADIC